MLQGARAAGYQLHAGPALGARTDTTCVAGTDNWKIHDPYRSKCYVQVTTAFAMDVPSLTSLSGLDTRLAVTGWHGYASGWTPTNNRDGVAGIDAWNRLGYRLKDLAYIGYSGPQSAQLFVLPHASATPVPTPQPPAAAIPGGAYFGSTEGTNWQEAWKQQRSRSPYLLQVTGSVTFTQPW